MFILFTFVILILNKCFIVLRINTMDELNKRVLEVMDFTGVSKSQFAAELEISLPVLTHLSSGRNKPSLDIITKILSTYKQINSNWLLFGEGKMLQKPEKAIDLSIELAEIKKELHKINDINTQLQQVINYHTIFMNEVKYLDQLSTIVKTQQLEASNIAKTIEEISDSINSKLLD